MPVIAAQMNPADQMAVNVPDMNERDFFLHLGVRFCFEPDALNFKQAGYFRGAPSDLLIFRASRSSLLS